MFVDFFSITQFLCFPLLLTPTHLFYFALIQSEKKLSERSLFLTRHSSPTSCSICKQDNIQNKVRCFYFMFFNIIIMYILLKFIWFVAFKKFIGLHLVVNNKKRFEHNVEWFLKTLKFYTEYITKTYGSYRYRKFPGIRPTCSIITPPTLKIKRK